MKQFSLNQNSELRFESDSKCTIKLLKGTAEYRGMELLQDKEYDFSETTGAIFTFHGCLLETENCTLEYISDESNIPLIFDNMNFKGTFGVVGKGRSTFTITIANFIVRIHKKVVITELDPETGNILFPGCIGTILNSHLIGPTSKNVITGFTLKEPNIWYYGSTNIKNKDQFLKLAKIILQKGESLAKENDCQHLVLLPNDHEIINKLEINNCFIIANERMHYTLNCNNKVKIQNTGYIEVARDIDRRIHNYFYGIYTPYTVSVKDMKIVTVDEYLPPASALPLGAERKVFNQEVRDVEPIGGSILGISQAMERDEVPLSPIIGFIVVSNAEKRKVLCPQSKLPEAKFLIQGEVRYSEYL
ncbi:Protein CLP1 like protein [Dictyocoela muelleri]|nr:Protein CLP1 like protein [Dictyocoela muelleri]